MKKYGFCYASRIYDLKNEMKVTHHSFVHREIGCQTEQVHGIRLKLHWPDGLGVWFVIRVLSVSRRVTFLSYVSFYRCLSLCHWIICTRIDWLCVPATSRPNSASFSIFNSWLEKRHLIHIGLQFKSPKNTACAVNSVECVYLLYFFWEGWSSHKLQ